MRRRHIAYLIRKSAHWNKLTEGFLHHRHVPDWHIVAFSRDAGWLVGHGLENMIRFTISDETYRVVKKAVRRRLRSGGPVKIPHNFGSGPNMYIIINLNDRKSEWAKLPSSARGEILEAAKLRQLL